MVTNILLLQKLAKLPPEKRAEVMQKAKMISQQIEIEKLNKNLKRVVNNLPAELLKAYTETDFIVHHTPTFTLKINLACPDLLQLFEKRKAVCATFITAHNPFSEALPADKNLALHKALKNDLKKRSLQFFEGIGQHPSGDWPGEQSFLVLDLDLAAATALAQHYEQNAFVWCDSDGIPQLVTT